MKDFQERVVVVDEKTELDKKLDALSEFLSSGESQEVPTWELDRLKRQQAIMANYSAVLDERISNF